MENNIKSSNKKTVLFIVITIAVCLLCTVFMLQLARKATGKTVNQMSQIYLQEIAVQKIGHLKTGLENRYTFVQIVAEALCSDDLKTDETLRAFLSRMKEYNNISFLAFVDDQGRYHNAVGVYDIDEKIGLIDGKTVKEQLSDNGRFLSYNNTILDEDIMLIGARIPEIKYNDCTFWGLIIGYRMDELRHQLSLGTDNAQIHSGIYKSDGQPIVDCGHSVSLEFDNNLFTEMNEKCIFKKGCSINKLKDDFANQQSDMMIFDIDDSREYMFYEPVADTDWYMIILMPYSLMDSTVGYLGDVLTRNSVIILIVVITVLLCSSYMLYNGMKKANLAMNVAKEKAEEANAAKSEFLSHMSHDIRTPLNGIMGMTDIAIKNCDNKPRVNDCLEKINGSSQHLLSLINDVLEMSRIESGKTKVVPKSMNMNTAIENCASIASSHIAGRNLSFVKLFDKFEHPNLIGDELHLRQILINILGNAVKFTPDNGSIYFRVKEVKSDGESALYRFEIEDTGIGMSEEFLKHIWEAFSQEDRKSVSTYAGTGLGMSITKKFVDMMNGNISVESEVGKGSKFIVEIAFIIDSESKDPETVIEENNNNNLQGINILLAEDNELNAEIATCFLEEMGAKITIVENGEKAFNTFKDAPPHTFDIILMDVMMPVMNGLEATNKIRSLEREDASSIPIIAMTANAYEEDIKATRKAGMNEHLSKPVNADEVCRTVRKLCKNKFKSF